MNKKDLINEVCWKLPNFTKKDIEEILNTSVKVAGAAVAKGDDVTLRGLGSFVRRTRVGRSGRNPNTGEVIEIPAKRVVKFRPALAFQEAVNANS